MARKAIKKVHVMEVEYIAFTLAKELMTWNEPIPEFNTRFPEKLESCLFTPFQTFHRKSLYKGLIKKASIMFYLMNKNHPFQNGNKRIAITNLIYFLSKNGRWLSVSNNKLYEFSKSVAGSDPKNKDLVISEIEEFLDRNASPYKIDIEADHQKL